MTGTTDELKVVSEPLGGGALARAALAGATPEGWYTPRLASASLSVVRPSHVNAAASVGAAFTPGSPARCAIHSASPRNLG